MSKVHLLDELTANQIAAGEVIERPASVVKELVENSLDAGTKRIVVEIFSGGLELLKVTDDGCGMSKEDVILAIKRHATSKINDISDLDRLQSLGFRGEALASITSVAKVKILTRELTSDCGVKLSVAGDKELFVEPVGTPIGTTIIVSDLFFNTPARKKFLRSEKYESGLIHELMMQFSLSHPEVDFRFLREGKEVLNTTGIMSPPDLLEYFYGNNVKEAIIEVKGELSGGKVSGYITLPTYHRINRKGMNFFINQRRVYAKELLKALEEAYENLLPKGLFPLCVLNLSLDPSSIDVNGHPSKLEVRLRNPLLVKELSIILQEELIKQQKIPRYIIEPEEFLGDTETKVEAKDETKDSEGGMGKGVQETFRNFYVWEQPTPLPSQPCDRAISVTNKIPVTKTVADIGADIGAEACTEAYTEAGSEEKQTQPLGLQPCQVIGQLRQTFILAEGEDGLYIIDQHIAHERVLFERLLEKATKGSLESQVLLNPVALHLTLLEEEAVIKYILPLVELGIIIEHFGPRSYLLRAIPSGVHGDPQDFFYSLLEHLENSKGKTAALDLKKEFLIHSSCKMAVKANTKLTLQEMEQLLLDLSQAKNFLTCPHGRPIIYKITNREILKAFHRL